MFFRHFFGANPHHSFATDRTCLGAGQQPATERAPCICPHLSTPQHMEQNQQCKKKEDARLVLLRCAAQQLTKVRKPTTTKERKMKMENATQKKRALYQPPMTRSRARAHHPQAAEAGEAQGRPAQHRPHIALLPRGHRRP
ncbi:unnamed protein product [Heterosigma akashiwo]|mmetsp:Transcript_14254/g.25485  ORF Transcript_14254/g.25485 Transcript_14254/m.25485 type:complete len:141 (+) Transcript_14254:114-536(+)